MPIVNSKFVISGWQELHSMIPLQQYFGRYAIPKFGRVIYNFFDFTVCIYGKQEPIVILLVCIYRIMLPHGGIELQSYVGHSSLRYGLNTLNYSIHFSVFQHNFIDLRVGMF